MSKTLSLGIVISAAGLGSTASVLGSLKSKVADIGATVTKLKGVQRAAFESMDRVWRSGLDAINKYEQGLGKLDQRLTQLRERHSKNRGDVNARLGDVAAAYGIGKTLLGPVSAFVRQDDALNALQVAMMDKTGKVSKDYDALRGQAVELGNILPGTTADFVGTARTLMEQGVAIESVLGGGLKAASHLSVVLRIPADAAGEMAAKLREAYKLSDSELVKMADAMQRAKFAFGMKPSDLMAASAYQAPMLNQMRITGIADTNKMLALQGLGAQVGLEGSSWGTNFSMMLTRLAKGPLMLKEAKKGMKAESQHMLDSLGIKFNFFDKKDNFAGLDHMVQELEKLQVIRKKLGDKAALEVAESMFGAEAGRPAMIIAEAGMKGFTEAQKKMADQASLDDRIRKTLESTRNTWESLTGSMENFAAAASGPAVQALHPLINGLNSAAGAMTDFAGRNPIALKWIGLTIGGLAGLAVGVLSLGAALAILKFAWSGVPVALVAGIRAVGGAVLFLGRALLLNPIGLAVTAIAGVAYLLYSNWASVSAWFAGLAAQFKGYGSAMIDGLLGGIYAKLTAAKTSIVSFGQNVKSWFAQTLGIKSPSRVFIGFGGSIADGAQIGITRGIPRVQGAVSKLSGVALAGAAMSASGASGATGAGMSITFAPTIQVTARGDVGSQVEQAVRVSFAEFERLMRDYEAARGRRAY